MDFGHLDCSGFCDVAVVMRQAEIFIWSEESGGVRLEVLRLMGIIINSVISNTDLLRELIFYAPDVVNKTRILLLTNRKVLHEGENIISAHDRKIGLMRGDLDKTLGAIAEVGVSALMENVQTSENCNLMRQIGVEFHMLCLVAYYVEAISKHNDVQQHVRCSRFYGLWRLFSMKAVGFGKDDAKARTPDYDSFSRSEGCGEVLLGGGSIHYINQQNLGLSANYPSLDVIEESVISEAFTTLGTWKRPDGSMSQSLLHFFCNYVKGGDFRVPYSILYILVARALRIIPGTYNCCRSIVLQVIINQGMNQVKYLWTGGVYLTGSSDGAFVEKNPKKHIRFDAGFEWLCGKHVKKKAFVLTLNKWNMQMRCRKFNRLKELRIAWRESKI